MVNDALSDFVNQLKTTSAVSKEKVVVSYSKFIHEIAKVLEQEGYLSSVTKVGKDVAKTLEVSIAKPVTYVRRHSKPSRRLYTDSRSAPQGRGGRGITVLTTPQGVMTSKEASQKHVGGEILFTLI